MSDAARNIAPTDEVLGQEGSNLKACPKCKEPGDIEADFGSRKTKHLRKGKGNEPDYEVTVVRPQSWCRKCRSKKKPKAEKPEAEVIDLKLETGLFGEGWKVGVHKAPADGRYSETGWVVVTTRETVNLASRKDARNAWNELKASDPKRAGVEA